MSHRDSSYYINASNLTLPVTDADTTSIYQTASQEETDTPTALLPDDGPSAPLTNDALTPHQVAINRTQKAKARLATTHEGWLLVAQALVRSGVIPRDEGLSQDMKDFGDAICGRYAAASLLWRVLVDMPRSDWFGPKKKFDATLRRLKTLKGLEASLMVWEKLVLGLVEFVDEDGELLKEECCEEVKGVLGKWRLGMPSKP